jgi:hypothetical protein
LKRSLRRRSASIWKHVGIWKGFAVLILFDSLCGVEKA